VRTSVPLSIRVLKPLIDAGPVFRSAGNLNGTLPSNHGFAAGLGVEAHVWRLRIAPQFRYLRWARRQYPYSSPLAVPDQV
jgi:hypothetical protein